MNRWTVVTVSIIVLLLWVEWWREAKRGNVVAADSGGETVALAPVSCKRRKRLIPIDGAATGAVPVVAADRQLARDNDDVAGATPQTDADDFVSLAHRCTDKTTAHRYQELYARALHRFRHRHGDQHVQLLEMGLGCNMPTCVAGGTRLLRSYLPGVGYHVLEFKMDRCLRYYSRSGVDRDLANYIQEHLCLGSSDDRDVLLRCGTQFGPFDVIIDDASHYQQHVTAGFRFWWTSNLLKAGGGVYIVEDLQVAQDEVYEGRQLGLDIFAARKRAAAHPPNHTRWVFQGKTFHNYAQSMLLCKTMAVSCGWPTDPQHSVIENAVRSTAWILIGHEAAALRKR